MQQKYSNIQPHTGVHFGGICNVRIAPKEWLAGEVVKNFLTNIVTSVPLKPSREFLTLKLIDQSYSFSEKVKNADAGQYFDIEISGESNHIDPSVLQVLETLRHHKFVAIVTDMKGRNRIVGNTFNGLTLMFGTTNGNSTGGEEHLPISLTMQSPEPAPYLNL